MMPPVSDARAVRELLELVLFTEPGERVNRPDFGAGLLSLVFEPNHSELASAVEVTAQAALHRWLSDVLEVSSVRVTVEDSTLRVDLIYRLLNSSERTTETVTWRRSA
jgi:phage baseplate assembly protein W